MLIYHGSQFIIEQPEYGKGKRNNDYGLGFYCTPHIELAKEWGCGEAYDGYANIYDLNITGLKTLELNNGNYNILHWLALLLKYRTFRLTNPIAKEAKTYLVERFALDLEPYDVIIGNRADDSYFSFAEDFLNNAISVKKLKQAMHLGKLGEQYVLKSQQAFSNLSYVGAEPALRKDYLVPKKLRDLSARKEYLESNRKHSFDKQDLYVMDILRQEVKADDARLF